MTEETKEETPALNKHKSKWGKRLFHYSLIPFNLFFQIAVTACFLILFFFYAPHQRDDIIKSQIEPLIKKVTNIHFEYDGLKFNGRGNIALKNLKLYDNKGLFAFAEHIETEIQLPSDYPNIKTVTADHIKIIRQPVLKKQEKKEKKTSAVFSKTPPMIFQNIDLKKVTLGKEVANKETSFKVKSNINSITNQYALNITPLSGYKIKADLKANIISDTKIAFRGNADFPAQMMTSLSARIPFKNMLSAHIKGSADIREKTYISFDEITLKDEVLKLNIKGNTLLLKNGMLQSLNLRTYFKDGKADIKFKKTNNIFDINTNFQNFSLDAFLIKTDPVKKMSLSGHMIMQLGSKIPSANGHITAHIVTNLKDKKIHDASGTVIFTPNFNKNKMTFDMAAYFGKSKIKAFDLSLQTDPITALHGNEKITGGFITVKILPNAFPQILRKQSIMTARDIILKGHIKGAISNPEFYNMTLDAKELQYNIYKSTLPHLSPMNLKAHMDISKEKMKISKAFLKGKINNIPMKITTSGASNLIYGKHDYRFDLADYKEKTSSHMTLFQKNKRSKLQIKGDFNVIPLSKILQPIADMPHTLLSGTYNTAFTPKNPLRSLSGHFQFKTEHRLEGENLGVILDGNIQKSVLGSNLAITNNNLNIGNGYVTYPLINKSLPASLKIETELEKLSLLTGQKMNEFSGLLNTELSFKNNHMNGFLSLENGSYHHKKLGTKLNNITTSATFKNDIIRFNEFTANDTKNGTLSLKGILSLNENAASDIVLMAKDFHLLNSSDLRAKTDTNLTLKGKEHKLLSGTANITDFLFLLPDLSHSAPKILNITETEQDKDTKISLLDKFLQKIKVDITSNIINTAKISGFGLNGTLGGDVKIKNTLLKPEVTGMINIDRGDFELLSKEFTITKGGLFIKENNPFFNVTAIREVDDVIITATMTGTTDDPNVAFSSSPSLPEDEIISYILFDGPKTSIGPIEALRITSALAALSQGKSGSGDMTDVVGSTERALGLDKININSDDQNNVRFGAGKYLTEKLYFSVDHGGAENNTIISLRLKLKDTLILEGYLNPNAQSQSENQSEIFLKYKKDY